MISETLLMTLGFERQDESDGADSFHYYTLDIGNEGLCLITNDNEDAETNGWSVTIFDHADVVFDKPTGLSLLVGMLKGSVLKSSENERS